MRLYGNFQLLIPLAYPFKCAFPIFTRYPTHPYHATFIVTRAAQYVAPNSSYHMRPTHAASSGAHRSFTSCTVTHHAAADMSCWTRGGTIRGSGKGSATGLVAPMFSPTATPTSATRRAGQSWDTTGTGRSTTCTQARMGAGITSSSSPAAAVATTFPGRRSSGSGTTSCTTPASGVSSCALPAVVNVLVHKMVSVTERIPAMPLLDSQWLHVVAKLVISSLNPHLYHELFSLHLLSVEPLPLLLSPIFRPWQPV